MNSSLSTCWSTIRSASAGDPQAREEFARRYTPPVRAYLAARWRHLGDDGLVEDAVQDVFMECFRPDGILDRVVDERPKEFRAFLYGVARNVALRIERHKARDNPGLYEEQAREIEARETSLSEVFDRAWAEAIVGEAAAAQARQAEIDGEDAMRRVELLRLRFGEGKPIRKIATEWDADPALVHRQYRVARSEFRKALESVVHFHYPDSPENANRALAEVLVTLDGEVPKDMGSHDR